MSHLLVDIVVFGSIAMGGISVGFLIFFVKTYNTRRAFLEGENEI